MSARVFGIYILFFLLKTLIKNGGAGNIWENLSDSFTQVQRLRLRRQISSGNERRQDYKPPPTPSPHILPEFQPNGDGANSPLSGLCFISERLSD